MSSVLKDYECEHCLADLEEGDYIKHTNPSTLEIEYYCNMCYTLLKDRMKKEIREVNDELYGEEESPTMTEEEKDTVFSEAMKELEEGGGTFH